MDRIFKERNHQDNMLKGSDQRHVGMPIEDGLKSNSSSNTSSIKEDEDDTNLEDRVKELEVKLATLSLLLQQQKLSRGVSPPPPPPNITPPLSPPPDMSPALDSPAPLRPSPQSFSHAKRNLSFQILHAGDSTSPAKSSTTPSTTRTAPQNAIFLPERLPRRTTTNHINTQRPNRLAAYILQHNNIQEELSSSSLENTEIIKETTTKEKSKKDSINRKWLDYLNSFQESNYDVDLQMEEFVKIPWAVETLLGFGFWICVDSFLYVLTVLPIRFVWSLLLLIRYCIIWAFQQQVPEGPFRFHRR
jgi:hypothetical protein